MQITAAQSCPTCAAAGRLDVPLVMDLEQKPLVYSCDQGHKFDEVPEAEPVVIPDTPQDSQARPVAEIVQQLDKAEPPAVEAVAVEAPQLAKPPELPPRVAALVEKPAAVAPAGVSSLVEKLKANFKARQEQEGAAMVPIVPASLEDLKAHPITLPNGDVLTAVLVPEAHAVNVRAAAEAKTPPATFAEYFEALVTVAFDLGWFENLNA